MTRALGWNVVTDNKPGVGGNIGMHAVAKAKPDGLTLAVGQTRTLAINPPLCAKLRFDPSAGARRYGPRGPRRTEAAAARPRGRPR